MNAVKQDYFLIRAESKLVENYSFQDFRNTFLEEISGKNPVKFSETRLEPDIEAGYSAGTGLSRISGRFLGYSEGHRN